jgi:hypothetical protein
MKDYSFQVETIEAGQRKSYGNSFYTYEVTSKEPFYVVKAFCVNILKRSYLKKDMPDPFVGKLIAFKAISETSKPLSEGVNDYSRNEGGVTYSYKVSMEYTG